MDVLEYSREDEIRDTQVKRPHVVILGAGASRAALPNGDRNGKRLPLMADLAEITGLSERLRSAGLDPKRDFEELYAELSESGNSDRVTFLNDLLEEYFWSLRLPDYPTIYDVLVLSLRPKDLIATFNWDPFLYQACLRNHKAVPQLPQCVYLHGSVAIGYCLKDHRKGMFGYACHECGKPYLPSKLLYPIKEKGYNTDPFISVEWKNLQSRLEHAFMLTVFGYSAPASDVEAMELISKGWGTAESRNLEQVEIIDVKSPGALRKTWSPLIHTHHYDITNDFFNSWIGRHPRRSCEADWQQFFKPSS